VAVGDPFLDLRLAVQNELHAFALEDDLDVRERGPPWLTKYTGPASGLVNNGVDTLALPMFAADGQPAGLLSN